MFVPSPSSAPCHLSFPSLCFQGSTRRNSPPEKHDRALVVDLIHAVEVGHLLVVNEVHRGEVLDLVGDLVQVLVHDHDGGVAGAAEAEDGDLALFREDGLVDVPGGVEVGEEDGAHGSWYTE